MKIRIGTVALLLLGAVCALAADVSGQWTGQMHTPDGDFAIEFTFKQEGSMLTGSVQGPHGDPSPISDGKVEGNAVTFTVLVHEPKIAIHYEGAASGDTIKLSSKSDAAEFPGGEITLRKGR